jgi:hypothetical protein
MHKWRYQLVWSAQIQSSAKMVRNRFMRSLYHLKTIRGSDELLLFVTLILEVDEVTNWFKMLRIRPPVEFK